MPPGVFVPSQDQPSARQMSLGGSLGWLPYKVQPCPTVPSATASSLLPRRQVGGPSPAAPLGVPFAGSMFYLLPHAGVSGSEQASTPSCSSRAVGHL